MPQQVAAFLHHCERPSDCSGSALKVPARTEEGERRGNHECPQRAAPEGPRASRHSAPLGRARGRSRRLRRSSPAESDDPRVRELIAVHGRREAHVREALVDETRGWRCRHGDLIVSGGGWRSATEARPAGDGLGAESDGCREAPGLAASGIARGLAGCVRVCRAQG